MRPRLKDIGVKLSKLVNNCEKPSSERSIKISRKSSFKLVSNSLVNEMLAHLHTRISDHMGVSPFLASMHTSTILITPLHLTIFKPSLNENISSTPLSLS